ncbi:MAG: hypothetical protein IT389_07745 [Nitrospira sp.]|nr:hypothetical protein [Nitrospira sp.]
MLMNVSAALSASTRYFANFCAQATGLNVQLHRVATLQKDSTIMIKTAILVAVIAAVILPYSVRAEVTGESFDVLGSVMETHKKEYNAKEILDSNKDETIRWREKIVAGYWEFMQVNSKAKPGEYCAATFLRGKRVKPERVAGISDGVVDGISDGMAVTLFGPGGNYRNALLGFSPLDKDHTFPKVKSGKPVLVTLKQGNLNPVTLNAIYMEVSPTAPPLLAFAVPSIEALMDGMKDDWHFEVIYEGRSIADITWHDGLKARDELKQCVAGKPFDDKIHLRF